MILIRSNKDFDDLRMFKGEIKTIGTTVTKIPYPLKDKQKDILYFTLKGLDTRLGIYRNTKLDYEFYLNKINPGDIVKVYFDEQGTETMENINLHVFQLEKDAEILLDKGKRNRTDRKVGLVLYGVGLLFSIAPIWFYLKKMRK